MYADTDPDCDTESIDNSIQNIKIMTTDELHITDAWLNAKYGEKETTIVRSLLKNLEIKIASDFDATKGFQLRYKNNYRMGQGRTRND